ncbi:MAG: hypothetical protein GTO14_10460 [Anaerolineales bacterium]|nr:hypothetical protein [Anaerolineales bacterium]
MFFRVSRWLLRVVFALLTRLSIYDYENLPTQGPYILVFNHMSIVDGALVFSILQGPRMTGWAAEKYERHLIYGNLIRLYGGIFIRRGQVDRDALSLGVTRIHQGYIFGLAPEGTRSKVGSLIRSKTGAAFLAHESHAPIVPIGIAGTEATFQMLARLRRPKIDLRIGKPFHLPPLNEETRHADLRRNTDEIMCRIALLLPEKYWGVYTGHPRLLELLEEQGLGIRD